MVVIPALGKLRQEDYMFEPSLGYTQRLLKKKKKLDSLPTLRHQLLSHRDSIFGRMFKWFSKDAQR